MNRAERRRATRLADMTDDERKALELAGEASCPDCGSEVGYPVLRDLVWWVEVAHDRSCPAFRRDGARVEFRVIA